MSDLDSSLSASRSSLSSVDSAIANAVAGGASSTSLHRSPESSPEPPKADVEDLARSNSPAIVDSPSGGMSRPESGGKAAGSRIPVAHKPPPKIGKVSKKRANLEAAHGAAAAIIDLCGAMKILGKVGLSPIRKLQDAAALTLQLSASSSPGAVNASLGTLFGHLEECAARGGAGDGGRGGVSKTLSKISSSTPSLSRPPLSPATPRGLSSPRTPRGRGGVGLARVKSKGRVSPRAPRTLSLSDPKGSRRVAKEVVVLHGTSISALNSAVLEELSAMFPVEMNVNAGFHGVSANTPTDARAAEVEKRKAAVSAMLGGAHEEVEDGNQVSSKSLPMGTMAPVPAALEAAQRSNARSRCLQASRIISEAAGVIITAKREEAGSTGFTKGRGSPMTRNGISSSPMGTGRRSRHLFSAGGGGGGGASEGHDARVLKASNEAVDSLVDAAKGVIGAVEDRKREALESPGAPSNPRDTMEETAAVALAAGGAVSKAFEGVSANTALMMGSLDIETVQAISIHHNAVIAMGRFSRAGAEYMRTLALRIQKAQIGKATGSLVVPDDHPVLDEEERKKVWKQLNDARIMLAQSLPSYLTKVVNSSAPYIKHVHVRSALYEMLRTLRCVVGMCAVNLHAVGAVAGDEDLARELRRARRSLVAIGKEIASYAQGYVPSSKNVDIRKMLESRAGERKKKKRGGKK